MNPSVNFAQSQAITSPRSRSPPLAPVSLESYREEPDSNSSSSAPRTSDTRAKQLDNRGPYFNSTYNNLYKMIETRTGRRQATPGDAGDATAILHRPWSKASDHTGEDCPAV